MTSQIVSVHDGSHPVHKLYEVIMKRSLGQASLAQVLAAHREVVDVAGVNEAILVYLAVLDYFRSTNRDGQAAMLEGDIDRLLAQDSGE